MRKRERVSHILCQFAEHAFGCDRLIMGNVVISSGIFLFCRIQKDDDDNSEKAPSE